MKLIIFFGIFYGALYLLFWSGRLWWMLKKLVDFAVMVLACFIASVVIYLLLLDKKHKPTTYKEFKLQHFFRWSFLLHLFSSYKSDALALPVLWQASPETLHQIRSIVKLKNNRSVKNLMIRWYLDLIIIVALLFLWFYFVYQQIAESFALWPSKS